MIVIRFTASHLVVDGLKNISQWGEMLNASMKQRIDIGLKKAYRTEPLQMCLNTQSCICELTGAPLILSCTQV